MAPVTIDANLIVRACVKGEPHRRTARALLRFHLQRGDVLIAPPMFESEVDSAIRRAVATGRMSTVQGNAARKLALQIPVEVVTAPALRQRAWEIAEQFGQEQVYDATYAALAEGRGCELWSADRRFWQAVKDKLHYVRYLLDFRLPKET